MKKQSTDAADTPAVEPVYTDSILSSNADTGVLVLETDRPDGSRVQVNVPGETILGTVEGGQIWVTTEQHFVVHAFTVDALTD